MFAVELLGCLDFVVGFYCLCLRAVDAGYVAPLSRVLRRSIICSYVDIFVF